LLKKRGIKSAEFDFKNIKFVVIMSINNTLSSIELKVSKLVESYTELKKIKSDLDTEKNQLFEKLNAKEIEIASLQEKIKLINISKTVDVSSDDIKNTRMKINSYVREIDKCIALLNS
jgi:predicted nuclease with TOPRIM domain|tara:strand:- start:6953 stop:7306 length:354 start_codon:yes stop_codon:yes gene_type:complete